MKLGSVNLPMSELLRLRGKSKMPSGDVSPTATPTKPRWKPTPWAFVSAVFRELEEYRDKAISACLRCHILPVGMEVWTAGTKPPAEKCKREVKRANVVVLIVIHRAGSIDPETQKPYVELEYDYAEELGKPVLAFVGRTIPGVSPTAIDFRDLERLQAFRKRLGKKMLGEFTSPEHLETLVYQALTEWKADAVSVQIEESDITIGQVISAYLETGTKRHMPDTVAERSLILRPLSESLGHIQVADARPIHLLKWLEQQTTWRKQNTRAGRVNRIMRVFNWAVSVGLIDKNPFKDLKGNPYAAFIGDPDVDAGFTAISDQDFRDLLTACKSPCLSSILIFIRCTGWRPIDARRLKWGNVDLQAKAAKCQGHATPLSPLMVDMLNQIRSTRGENVAPEQHVFLNLRNRHWEWRQSFNGSFRRLVIKAGLQNVTPSCLTEAALRQSETLDVSANELPIQDLIQSNLASIAGTTRRRSEFQTSLV